MNPPTNDSSGQRITLHIEELVLHGARPGDRHHIADAVQTELHRLLTERGLPAWAHGELLAPQLEGGQFTASRGSTGTDFGIQVADSVYRATQAQDGAKPAADKTVSAPSKKITGNGRP